MQTSKPTFGGHEKFVFRHGWLKKGFDAIADDAGIFTNENALVILGVGKNMVRSIRHWCLTTGIVQERVDSAKSRGLAATTFGEQLFANGGWDPYLEDTGSLWLLHWQLASNKTRSLVWHISFSTYYETEFTKKQLISFVGKQLERMGVTTTPGMVEREVDCCLRTYVPATRSHVSGPSEESLDCPLAELGLIRFTTDDNVYRFNTGPKPTLPVEVFGYGLLEYLEGFAGSRRTVAIDECVYHQGSPGQVFKLDENSVAEYLEELANLTEGRLQLQETAGLQQIYLHDPTGSSLQNSVMTLLGRYYGQY